MYAGIQHDYAALIKEYDQRLASGEAHRAIVRVRSPRCPCGDVPKSSHASEESPTHTRTTHARRGDRGRTRTAHQR